MISALFQKKLVRSAAALAAVGTIAGAVSLGSSANADPRQYTNAIVGFGSDTTQDISNTFAGFSNGSVTPELISNGLSGSTYQIVSWDAFGTGGCITPKVAAPQIVRPNGSGNGVRMLSAAFSPAADTWPFAATASCSGAKNPQGMIDFARSSSGPGSAANPNGSLTWIPFGRDAMSFAYVRPSGTPTVSISAADLATLHGTGPQLIGGVPVIACGIQVGSGTRATWLNMLGLTTSSTPAASVDAGTDTCNLGGNGLRLQENHGPELLAKAAALSSISHDICDGVAGPPAAPCTNAQVVIGFSASQYIARSNDVGSPNPMLEGTATGGLGRVNGEQAVTGTLPNLQAVASAYGNTTFGRNVFNVVPFGSIDTANFTDVAHIVDMFVGTGSEVCSATSTIISHGFLPLDGGALGACGTTNTRGNFSTS